MLFLNALNQGKRTHHIGADVGVAHGFWAKKTAISKGDRLTRRKRLEGSPELFAWPPKLPGQRTPKLFNIR
jgi:hypothetical protein